MTDNARAAGWGAERVKSYLDLQKGEEAFIASLVRALDLVGPDEEDRKYLFYYRRGSAFPNGGR